MAVGQACKEEEEEEEEAVEEKEKKKDRTTKGINSDRQTSLT